MNGFVEVQWVEEQLCIPWMCQQRPSERSGAGRGEMGGIRPLWLGLWDAGGGLVSTSTREVPSTLSFLGVRIPDQVV